MILRQGFSIHLIRNNDLISRIQNSRNGNGHLETVADGIHVHALCNQVFVLNFFRVEPHVFKQIVHLDAFEYNVADSILFEPMPQYFFIKLLELTSTVPCA